MLPDPKHVIQGPLPVTLLLLYYFQGPQGVGGKSELLTFKFDAWWCYLLAVLYCGGGAGVLVEKLNLWTDPGISFLCVA